MSKTTNIAEKIQELKETSLLRSIKPINEDRNGFEIIVGLNVLIEQFSDYKIKHQAKQLSKKLLNIIEPQIDKVSDTIFDRSIEDAEFLENAIKKKRRMYEQIGSLNEAELMIFSDFVKEFVENKEIAKKKKQVFFDKILK